MYPRREYRWKDGKSLVLGSRPLVMGVLNVTPDSFSDGGKWNDPERSVAHLRELTEAGAALVDLGAESSRPGFVPISAAAEKERLEPLIGSLVASSSLPLSIDTYKAETAAFALDRGVHMLNDIWGLQGDPEMAPLAADRDVPVVCMHNDSKMDHDEDLIDLMKRFFDRTLEIASKAGIREENLIFDPGIGFGKNHAGNVEVLRRLKELTAAYPVPWLLGTSRKGFYQTYCNLPLDQRDEATGATALWGYWQGCQIFRVHQVTTTERMLRFGALMVQDGQE